MKNAANAKPLSANQSAMYAKIQNERNEGVWTNELRETNMKTKLTFSKRHSTRGERIYHVTTPAQQAPAELLASAQRFARLIGSRARAQRFFDGAIVVVRA